MANIFSLYGSVYIDNEKANKSIDDTTKKGSSMGDKLGSAFKTVTNVALGLGTAALSTAGAIGTMAVNSQKNMDQAMNSFISQTNIAKEESQEWQTALENIYKNNYGESFQDISDAMAVAAQQLYELDASQIEKVTENALALRDAFGVEVSDSIRATKTLITQFGVSADEAYNLMAQGAQNGLDFSGEFIDNIDEYSVQFNKLGLSAEDMFNIFQSGSDAGAFNLDKIGDAVKEFSIRAIDGSETTKEGFKALGLDADEMAKKFAAGGDTAKEAFYQVVDALGDMEDPLAQNTAGVNLFGTMWEDLGPEVVTQLGSIRDLYDGTEESMNKVKAVKYDDIGSMFEGLKRNVEMLLLPLGNALMPLIVSLMNLIMDNMPLIESLINQITPVITQLFTSLMPSIQTIIDTVLPLITNLISEVLPILIELLQMILPPVMQIVEAVLPIFVELIQMLLPPIMQIVEMVLPLLVSLIQIITPLLQPLLALLQPFIDLFMSLVTPLLQIVNMILPPIINLLTNIISFILPALQAGLTMASSIISGVFGGALNNISAVLNNVKGVFGLFFAKGAGVSKVNLKTLWHNII